MPTQSGSSAGITSLGVLPAAPKTTEPQALAAGQRHHAHQASPEQRAPCVICKSGWLLPILMYWVTRTHPRAITRNLLEVHMKPRSLRVWSCKPKFASQFWLSQISWWPEVHLAHRWWDPQWGRSWCFARCPPADGRKAPLFNRVWQIYGKLREHHNKNQS